MGSSRFDFNNLPEETREYLKCAINIFRLLEQKEVTNEVYDVIHGHHRKTYNKLDKKVLALFMAGFMEGSSSKETIEECDDVTLDNLLDFSKIDLNEIIPMEEEKYEEFYNKHFKIQLMSFIEEQETFYNVITISPEVIIYSMNFHLKIGSDIIDHIIDKYSVNRFPTLMSEHPIFVSLEFSAFNKGDFSKKDFSNKKISDDHSLPPFPPLMGQTHSNMECIKTHKTVEDSGLEEPKEKMKIDLSGERIWDYLEVLKSKFIGQEEFAEEIFYNIVNNVQLARMKDVNAGRSIIFVDGPSGTGKTAITTDIAEKLGVPCVCKSITHFTASGYVGGDLKDFLEDLYEKAGHNLELAQRGIIIIDEFDKIAANGDKDLRMKQAVQDQLLSLLGGEKYSLSMGMPLFGGHDFEFDTSKLTIVCLGAITNLREEKTSNKQSIGFSTEEKTEESSYIIKPEDLIKMGLQKELVGRINTFLHTKDYSVEDLERILRESSISPILGLIGWAEALGKKVEVDDEVYPLIAEKAYDLNTGARSLQTVVNSIRTRFLKPVLRGEETDLHIGTDDVAEAYSKTISRAKRG